MMTNKQVEGAASEEVVALFSRIFDDLRAMFAAGKGADEIVAFLNWPDSTVASPSPPHVYHGVAELMPSAHEYVLGMGRNVTFEIVAPVIASGNLAVVLTKITCRHGDRPDDVSMAQYAWQRRGDDWKVIAEAVVPLLGE